MDPARDRHRTLEGAAADLHVCPGCRSDLVHPVEWTPVDARHWRVELRCPECERRSLGIYDQATLDRFDAILDAGTDAMVASLRRIQRSNIEAESARLNVALEGGLILPEDF